MYTFVYNYLIYFKYIFLPSKVSVGANSTIM